MEVATREEMSGMSKEFTGKMTMDWLFYPDNFRQIVKLLPTARLIRVHCTTSCQKLGNYV